MIEGMRLCVVRQEKPDRMILTGKWIARSVGYVFVFGGQQIQAL
jgi:hypothetical protein